MMEGSAKWVTPASGVGLAAGGEQSLEDEVALSKASKEGMAAIWGDCHEL